MDKFFSHVIIATILVGLIPFVQARRSRGVFLGAIVVVIGLVFIVVSLNLEKPPLKDLRSVNIKVEGFVLRDNAKEFVFLSDKGRYVLERLLLESGRGPTKLTGLLKKDKNLRIWVMDREGAEPKILGLKSNAIDIPPENGLVREQRDATNLFWIGIVTAVLGLAVIFWSVYVQPYPEERLRAGT